MESGSNNFCNTILFFGSLIVISCFSAVILFAVCDPSKLYVFGSYTKIPEILDTNPVQNLSPKITKKIVRIGHRGTGYADENTIHSFAKALELGVDMIEFDIHQTADNRFVVIHDKSIDRTTNETGLVANMTLAEISQYKTKHNHRIPTLEQALNFIGTKAMINIEIKSIKPDSLQILADIINNYSQKDFENAGVNNSNSSLDQCKLNNNIVISCFNHYLISEFKKYCPSVRTMALLEGLPISLAEFGTKANVNIIGISQDFISKEFVDDAHQRNLSVYVYTLNTMDEINTVLAMGADGIISDFPDIIPKYA